MKQPKPELLQRELPDNWTKILAPNAELLRRVVDFGTNLVSMYDRVKLSRNYTALSLLLRHEIQIVDAISILANSGAVEACRIPLRALLEGEMGILYILAPRSEVEVEQRCLQHTHGVLRHSISWSKKQDHNTPEGRAAAQAWRDDGFSKPLPHEDSTATVTSILKILKQPEFAPIEAEYQRTREVLGNRPISWYSLFSGPRSVRGLAEQVKQMSSYLFTYDLLSGESHGSLTYQMVEGSDGAMTSRPLRWPAQLALVMMYSVGLIERVYVAIIDRYLADEKPRYNQWYAENVKPGIDRLRQVRWAPTPQAL
jgi:hypothetical protein